MRWVLISVSFAAILGLASTAIALYIDRVEVLGFPGLSFENHTVVHDQRQQEGEAGTDAFQMYWADDLIRSKPYTALVVSDTLWMLGDGNRILHHSQSRYFRDSAGHLRLEQGLNSEELPDALNPVHTRVFYEGAAGDKSYIRQDGAERSSFAPARSNDFNLEFARAKGVAVLSLPKLNDTQDIKRTSLGVKKLEDLNCRGLREDVTIPAGKIGNQLPIHISSEIWYSPKIAAVVQSTVKDPRIGEISYKLEQVRLGEPNRNLTEPPIAPIKQ